MVARFASEVNVKKQEKIDITTGSLKKILVRMPNWKSPGPDLVQGFCMKDKSKDNVASNYRPITYFPLMCKLLTGLITDQMRAFRSKEVVIRRAERVQERF